MGGTRTMADLSVDDRYYFLRLPPHMVDYFLRGSSREERRDATNSPEIPAAFPIRNGLAAMHGSKRTAVIYCTY